jgi:hypothetical protein
MAVAAHLGGELTVWASGCAARSVACALPLCGGVAAARLEAAALELSDDAAYMEKLHVPGIRAMGGIAGCLALAPCPVALF